MRTKACGGVLVKNWHLSIKAMKEKKERKTYIRGGVEVHASGEGEERSPLLCRLLAKDGSANVLANDLVEVSKGSLGERRVRLECGELDA